MACNKTQVECRMTFIQALKASAVKPESGLSVARRWRGDICRLSVTNQTKSPIAVPEVVVFDFLHGLPPETPLYAEAFQMLSQLSGTLASPTDVGYYPDRTHYRIPEPDGLRTGYGMMMLSPDHAPRILLGFVSCRRFIGRFSFDAKRLRISVDTEGLVLAPGQTWELEEFLCVSGDDREALLDRLTKAIATRHPRLKHDPVPTGWCSWYCFGPGVTDKNIYDNLDWMATNLPALHYVQIDDGYQPHMGDWLDTGKAFGGSVQTVLKTIRTKGFEPALWVAPFIADGQSRLFHEHPDWFLKDKTGAPMPSSNVGFGGWRMGPWYCLDGTHPEVQAHLESLFRTMHTEWGVTYFKLDANYWGAIHGGRHHDANATRIESYRCGIAAILRGAGKTSVILGCNHPIWPSLGLIHASRSSNDIDRSWDSFTKTGRENLLRGWQNGRFWWNDPDCLCLTGDLPENEFLFHATLLYATGGMLLSGDDLTKISPERQQILEKMLPATGVCARFSDESFTVGQIKQRGKKDRWVLFNWSDTPEERHIPGEKTQRFTNVWTGERVTLPILLPPRSGYLLEMA
jgi:alpha-galactosidase